MRPPHAEATVERISDRELIVTRTISGPASRIFQAWARPDLFRRWWAPASFGLTIVAYDADVRTGGTYRLELAHPAAEQTMAFFGKYLEVVPDRRIVWTNDEGDQDGPVTSVRFEDRDGDTIVTINDLYPSRESLDAAIASGGTSGWGEQLAQLDALLSDPGGVTEAA